MNRPAPEFEKVPIHRGRWTRIARLAGLENLSLKACHELNSGSRVSNEQFILFRSVCPPMQKHIVPATFRLNMAMQQAGTLLTGSADFQDYLTSMNQDPSICTSRFYVPLKQQCKVLSGLLDKSKLGTYDEECVNVSLISFLQAIAGIISPSRADWQPTRVRLHADFGKVSTRNGSEDRHYSAIADGQLQSAANNRIMALVECKVNITRKQREKVTMQEIAELVAWVKEFPDNPNDPEPRFRYLVSQYGKYTFVSFFEYDQNWMEYITHNRASNNGFAKLRKFGPYSIDNPVDMEYFAQLIIAIML